jgi:hypothetical protein
MHFMLPEKMLAAPRKFPFFDRFSYLKIQPPAWASDDKITKFFEQYRHALVHGRLILAAIVQANNKLFSPGSTDRPALITYDLDSKLKPEELVRLARRIFALRSGEPANDEEQHLADHLNDEYERSFGWSLPPDFAPPSCRISTIFFARKHLPGRYLQEKILPVCVDPETGVAVMFPMKYWD